MVQPVWPWPYWFCTKKKPLNCKCSLNFPVFCRSFRHLARYVKTFSGVFLSYQMHIGPGVQTGANTCESQDCMDACQMIQCDYVHFILLCMYASSRTNSHRNGNAMGSIQQWPKGGLKTNLRGSKLKIFLREHASRTLKKLVLLH